MFMFFRRFKCFVIYCVEYVIHSMEFIELAYFSQNHCTVLDDINIRQVLSKMSKSNAIFREVLFGWVMVLVMVVMVAAPLLLFLL